MARGWVAWFCAFRGDGQDRCVLLRRGQLIARRRDLWEQPGLVQELAQLLELGAGIIRFEGLNLALMLLICGESNAVAALVKAASKPGNASLRRIVSGPWGVLNPSHHAYWSQSKMTGFAKVGRVGNAGPTLAHHVQPGPGSACFIVHRNNYMRLGSRPDAERRTRDYSSVVFTQATGRSPLMPDAGALTNHQHSPQWSAARYQIALPSEALASGNLAFTGT